MTSKPIIVGLFCLLMLACGAPQDNQATKPEASGPEVIKDFVLTPAVYYQTTLNNTINEDDDEVWTTLNLRYTF